MKISLLGAFTKNISLAFSGWEITLQGCLNNKHGEWWLISQAILILAHLLKPWPELTKFGFYWPQYLNYIGLFLFLIGIILAIQAFFGLGPNLSPLPEPKKGANSFKKVLTAGVDILFINL